MQRCLAPDSQHEQGMVQVTECISVFKINVAFFELSFNLSILKYLPVAFIPL